MFYLMTHNYLASGSLLDNEYYERENLLPPLHELLFRVSSKGSFIYTIPQTGLCYTSCGVLAGMRKTQWVSPGGIDPMIHHTMPLN